LKKNVEGSKTKKGGKAGRVFVNAELSSVQQRNLEIALGVPVLDRVGLIIDIFAQRAATAEGRLQVSPYLCFP
jgi:50S ribosomal subunit-associated GTPase HflX